MKDENRPKEDLLRELRKLREQIAKFEQLEAERKLAEEKYRVLFENLTDFVYTMDLEGNFTNVNKAAERLTGYTRAELIGMNYKDYTPPESHERIFKAFHKVFETGKPLQDFPLEVFIKDGSKKYFETSVAPLWKGDKIIGFQGSSRDVTDRKQVIEEARSWQKRYETIIAATGEVIYDWDIETDQSTWGGSLKSVLGYTPEEFTGKEQIWESSVHPEDLPGVNEFIEKVLQGSATSFEVEYRFRHKDGTYRYVLDRGLIFRDEKGKAIQVLGSLTDITKQKIAEKAAAESQRLQTVLYQIANAASKVEDLNEFYKSIHEYLSAVIDTTNFYIAFYDAEKDLLSFPYFVDEMDKPVKPQPPGKGVTAHVLRNGKSLFLTKQNIYDMAERGEIEIIGTPPELWLGVPLKVEDQVVGVVAVQSYADANLYTVRDLEVLEFVSGQIADAIVHKRVEEAIKRSEEKYRILSRQLAETNSIKELLLDVITHDLKNPAGVICGMADFLLEENPDDEMVQVIRESCANLLKVIENATILSQVAVGETINKRELDLGEIIEKVIQECKPLLKKSGMSCEYHLEKELMVRANPIIEEIFRNYIINAIKHASIGKRVVIDAGKKDDSIVVKVKDFGNSIPREDYQRIFERRTQLDSGIKRGRGLGLAIVKRIAEAHGGEVWVEANKPKGNVFYLKIPCE